MKEASLVDLVCPACRVGTQCQGILALSWETFPLVRAVDDSEEVLEGIVCCKTCGAMYPIIAGILILAGAIKTYLAQHYSEIMSVAASSVSAAMVAYLQKEGCDLHDTGFKSSDWENARGMSLYISAHYDNIASTVGASPPLAEMPQNLSRTNLYTQVMELASPALGPDKQVLDIGCKVGGMTWRLAQTCKFVYGVDGSFKAALTARRILLGHPEPMNSYRYFHEGLDDEERPLSFPRPQNVEILVASGLELPFVGERFQLVNCANVVDIVGQPDDLLKELLRVVDRRGHVLHTDPYCWNVEEAPIKRRVGGESGRGAAEAFRNLLEQSCDIVGDRDGLAWILRTYDRRFNLWLNHYIWLNHCILAKRK